MPGLEPSESAPPPVAIADQIVVGFDHKKLVADSLEAAYVRVDVALKRLHELGAKELKRFIAESSNEEFFFALAVIYIDNPELTLADLRKSKDAALADTWFEHNVPVVMAGVTVPI